ncbi:hypothetical protein KAH94_04995 [bacterium]|nr:hypothetical protein [bacterium]
MKKIFLLMLVCSTIHSMNNHNTFTVTNYSRYTEIRNVNIRCIECKDVSSMVYKKYYCKDDSDDGFIDFNCTQCKYDNSISKEKLQSYVNSFRTKAQDTLSESRERFVQKIRKGEKTCQEAYQRIFSEKTKPEEVGSELGILLSSEVFKGQTDCLPLLSKFVDIKHYQKNNIKEVLKFFKTMVKPAIYELEDIQKNKILKKDICLKRLFWKKFFFGTLIGTATGYLTQKRLRKNRLISFFIPASFAGIIANLSIDLFFKHTQLKKIDNNIKNTEKRTNEYCSILSCFHELEDRYLADLFKEELFLSRDENCDLIIKTYEK